MVVNRAFPFLTKLKYCLFIPIFSNSSSLNRISPISFKVSMNFIMFSSGVKILYYVHDKYNNYNNNYSN